VCLLTEVLAKKINKNKIVNGIVAASTVVEDLKSSDIDLCPISFLVFFPLAF